MRSTWVVLEDEQHISQRQFTCSASTRCNRRAGICDLSTNLFQRLTNAFGCRMGKTRLTEQNGKREKWGKIKWHEWYTVCRVTMVVVWFRVTLSFWIPGLTLASRVIVGVGFASVVGVAVCDTHESRWCWYRWWRWRKWNVRVGNKRCRWLVCEWRGRVYRRKEKRMVEGGGSALWFGLLNCKQIPTFCSIDYRSVPSAETSEYTGTVCAVYLHTASMNNTSGNTS